MKGSKYIAYQKAYISDIISNVANNEACKMTSCA